MLQCIAMQTEFTLTQQEYIKANKLYNKPVAKDYLIFLVFFIAMAALAFLGSKPSHKFMAVFGVIGAIVGHLFVRHLYAPFITKKQYQNYQAAKEPMSISISNTAILLKSQFGQANIEWSRIIKWRKNESLILIYQAPGVYHIIPKRIGAIANELSGLLAKNVGNAT